MHTNHPCTKWICCREYIASHQTFRNRNICLCCKIKKFFFCLRNFYTATSVDDRAFTCVNKFCSLFDLFIENFRNCNCTAEVCSLKCFFAYCCIWICKWFKFILSSSYIFWNINQYRTWTARFCDYESITDCLSKIFNIHYHKVVLCNRHCYACNINFLE